MLGGAEVHRVCCKVPIVRTRCVVQQLTAMCPPFPITDVEEIVMKAQVFAGGRGKGTFMPNGFKGGVQLSKECVAPNLPPTPKKVAPIQDNGNCALR